MRFCDIRQHNKRLEDRIIWNSKIDRWGQIEIWGEYKNHIIIKQGHIGHLESIKKEIIHEFRRLEKTGNYNVC